MITNEQRFESVKKWFEYHNFDLKQYETISPEDLNKLHDILYHVEYKEITKDELG